MLKKKLHKLSFAYSLSILVILSSCIKEYSYEGGMLPPIIIDTLNPPTGGPSVTPDFPPCAACAGRDYFEENRWSFWAGNSFVCGLIDTAIVNQDRTALTFFGVSACSVDTSMALTIYLAPSVLNRSQQDVVSSYVAFYFTKFGAPAYLLISRWGTPFSLTIASYDHVTKMSYGTFSGYAYKADGNTLLVHSAKFQVRLY